MGLAKFTVKRGAANKLSIRRGIARKAVGGEDDSKALREITRVVCVRRGRATLVTDGA